MHIRAAHAPPLRLFGIQACRGFVGQEDRRLGEKRTADSQTPLLSTTNPTVQLVANTRVLHVHKPKCLQQRVHSFYRAASQPRDLLLQRRCEKESLTHSQHGETMLRLLEKARVCF